MLDDFRTEGVSIWMLRLLDPKIGLQLLPKLVPLMLVDRYGMCVAEILGRSPRPVLAGLLPAEIYKHLPGAQGIDLLRFASFLQTLGLFDGIPEIVRQATAFADTDCDMRDVVERFP